MRSPTTRSTTRHLNGPPPETWQAAARVLVEADSVDQLARRHLPRRPHVAVIAHDLDDATIHARAVAIGAEYVGRDCRSNGHHHDRNRL